MRVILAVTRLLLRQQELGLYHMPSRCSVFLGPMVGSTESEGQRCIHLSYNRMWDETQVRHKRSQDKDKRFRDNNTALLVQTMVQRGGVQVMLLDGSSDRTHNYEESWLVLPKEVGCTSAECLLPAITEAMPQPFCLTSPGHLSKTAQAITSVTVMPVGDKASGNIKILKHWAKEVQTTVKSEVGTKVL